MKYDNLLTRQLLKYFNGIESPTLFRTPSVYEMRDACQSGDYIKMGLIAHKLKTSLHYMGICSISAEIGELELFEENKMRPVCMLEKICKIEDVVIEVIRKLNEFK